MTEQAMITLDDGDGTVDANSLEVCTRWPSTVKVYRVPGVIHSGLLDVDQVIDIVEFVATNNEKKLRDWKEPAYSVLRASANTTIATKEQLLVSKDAGLMNLWV